MQPPESKRGAPDPTTLGIVIIEEDKLMRGLLAEWLSAEGYSVRAAAPGDPSAQDGADLVIVDVYMPRHEGAAEAAGHQGRPPGDTFDRDLRAIPAGTRRIV